MSVLSTWGMLHKDLDHRSIIVVWNALEAAFLVSDTFLADGPGEVNYSLEILPLEPEFEPFVVVWELLVAAWVELDPSHSICFELIIDFSLGNSKSLATLVLTMGWPLRQQERFWLWKLFLTHSIELLCRQDSILHRLSSSLPVVFRISSKWVLVALIGNM